MSHAEGSLKREVYSINCLQKKLERSYINDLMIYVGYLEQ